MRARGVAIPVVTVAYRGKAENEVLARIASTCQGRALTATPDDVADIFQRIALLF